jgi:hypothetical protein
MDATTIAVIGIAINAVSACVMLASVLIMVNQTREMRRSTNATAFESVYNILQSDAVHSARSKVYSLENKNFESWTDDEKKIAEKVCCSFDGVGIMCQNNMIPVEVVADSWGYALRRTWRILAPMVTSYRVAKNSVEYWDDFEWLAHQAENYQKTIYSEKNI